MITCKICTHESGFAQVRFYSSLWSKVWNNFDDIIHAYKYIGCSFLWELNQAVDCVNASAYLLIWCLPVISDRRLKGTLTLHVFPPQFKANTKTHLAAQPFCDAVALNSFFPLRVRLEPLWGLRDGLCSKVASCISRWLLAWPERNVLSRHTAIKLWPKAHYAILAAPTVRSEPIKSVLWLKPNWPVPSARLEVLGHEAAEADWHATATGRSAAPPPCSADDASYRQCRAPGRVCVCCSAWMFHRDPLPPALRWSSTWLIAALCHPQ